MLIGNAVHNIDAKGRVVIPAKYREDLGLSVVAVKSADGCIRVYPKASYEQFLEKLRQGTAPMVKLRRKLIINAEELALDSQGRILISEETRLSVGIKDKVRMVGMIDWIEFWNEEELEKVNEANEMSPEEEMALMEQLGLA